MFARGFHKNLIKTSVRGHGIMLTLRRSSDGQWTVNKKPVARYSFYREFRRTEKLHLPYRVFILFAGEWSLLLAVGGGKVKFI